MAFRGWRASGKSTYLTWMFERRGTHRAQFGLSAAELTPMAYRDLLQAERLAA